jgi:hypothetical protein
MTVAELIAKLQEFPPDAKVDFSADQGFISTDRPEFLLLPDEVQDIDGTQVTLHIDLDG